MRIDPGGGFPGQARSFVSGYDETSKVNSDRAKLIEYLR